MIGIIVTIALLVPLGWFVYNTVKKYRAAEGAWHERLLAGAKDSATIFWAYVLYGAGWLIDAAGNLAEMLNSPEIANFIHTQIPVQYVGYGLLAIGFITLLARLRSL